MDSEIWKTLSSLPTCKEHNSTGVGETQLSRSNSQNHRTKKGKGKEEKRRKRKVRGRRQSAATISLDNGLKFKEEVDLVIQRMK